MFDAWWLANRLAIGMFLGLENAAMERLDVRSSRDRANGTDRDATQIVNEKTYVGRMTKAANRATWRACQGLHNGPVLAYGFSRTVPLTVDCRLS
jgi:hypothetical protein